MNLNVGEKWMKWTLYEAGTKTAVKILQKVVGNISASLAHVFLATMIIGLVQVITGYAAVRIKGIKLIGDRVDILGSCLSGFFAVFAVVLGCGVFYYDGDIGVSTFIIAISIVPGALIDRFFFNHRLNRREWLGVAVAILAGYAILGWPSLSEFAKLPLWVWLSFGVMLSTAINQGITQKVKKIDPFVKNFWGGLITFLLCVVILLAIGKSSIIFDFSGSTPKLWAVSALIGLIVVGMWAFNLLSYKGGASIAIKKLVMFGTYLISTMICGILFFGEPASADKGVGVILYFAAFALMDKGTWEYISRLWNGIKN
ncbi:MAG: DMT family transporter [Patescibacteria group bacterium]|nr:DMT family transporter [Patescibacteria group bacterium]